MRVRVCLGTCVSRSCRIEFWKCHQTINYYAHSHSLSSVSGAARCLKRTNEYPFALIEVCIFSVWCRNIWLENIKHCVRVESKKHKSIRLTELGIGSESERERERGGGGVWKRKREMARHNIERGRFYWHCHLEHADYCLIFDFFPPFVYHFCCSHCSRAFTVKRNGQSWTVNTNNDGNDNSQLQISDCLPNWTVCTNRQDRTDTHTSYACFSFVTHSNICERFTPSAGYVVDICVRAACMCVACGLRCMTA